MARLWQFRLHRLEFCHATTTQIEAGPIRLFGPLGAFFRRHWGPRSAFLSVTCRQKLPANFQRDPHICEGPSQERLGRSKAGGEGSIGSGQGVGSHMQSAGGSAAAGEGAFAAVPAAPPGLQAPPAAAPTPRLTPQHHEVFADAYVQLYCDASEAAPRRPQASVLATYANGLLRGAPAKPPSLTPALAEKWMQREKVMQQNTSRPREQKVAAAYGESGCEAEPTKTLWWRCSCSTTLSPGSPSACGRWLTAPPRRRPLPGLLRRHARTSLPWLIPTSLLPAGEASRRRPRGSGLLRASRFARAYAPSRAPRGSFPDPPSPPRWRSCPPQLRFISKWRT